MSLHCGTLTGMDTRLAELLSAHTDRIRPWGYGMHLVDERYVVSEQGSRWDAWDRDDVSAQSPLGGFYPGGRDTAADKIMDVLTWPPEWLELSVADLRLAVAAWQQSSLRRGQ